MLHCVYTINIASVSSACVNFVTSLCACVYLRNKLSFGVGLQLHGDPSDVTGWFPGLPLALDQ